MKTVIMLGRSKMPLLTKKLLFCDLETTGLDPVKNGIYQMAFQVYIKGQFTKRFHITTCPFEDDEIEEKALDVGNVTEDQIRKYQVPIVAHKTLKTILRRYVDPYIPTDKFFFIGYNPNFDKDFLCEWFKKCGDPYFMSWIFWPPIDVAQLALFDLIEERHKMKRFNLETITKHYAIDGEKTNYHDAAYDIEMTKRIFFHILKQADE